MDIPARTGDFNICRATTPDHLAGVRALFLEYATALEISLCFQNFEHELASLPGNYAPPRGRLLFAQDGDQMAGCVGVRQLEQGVCEMKRLFVRPAWRGRRLGRALAETIIAAACEIGYDCMRLDTLDSMQPAISLYRSLGFRQIPPYYDNPSQNVVFMELPLNVAGGTLAPFARPSR
jgi:putative acetyltransferase